MVSPKKIVPIRHFPLNCFLTVRPHPNDSAVLLCPLGPLLFWTFTKVSFRNLVLPPFQRSPVSNQYKHSLRRWIVVLYFLCSSNIVFAMRCKTWNHPKQQSALRNSSFHSLVPFGQMSDTWTIGLTFGLRENCSA